MVQKSVLTSFSAPCFPACYMSVFPEMQHRMVRVSHGYLKARNLISAKVL